MKAKGNTQKHAEEQARRVVVVLDGCGCMFWPDLSASKAQALIADMRAGNADKKGASARTANAYLQTCKQFCGWMVKDDRAPTNPLAHLERYNAQTDVRVRRRALTLDECRLLVETVERSTERFGMSGLERAMLYRVAIGTGLRVSELRSLKTENFDLDANTPTVTLEACYSKHRRRDVQPIARPLVGDLRAFLAHKDPECPLFSPHSDKTADMLRADLAEAGISAEDSAGGKVDFHALRHTFITLGAQWGIAPKSLMDLARHSDINLTMRVYSHTIVADRAKALEAIPDLKGDGKQVQRATGTYDQVSVSPPFPGQNDKQNDKRIRELSQVTTPHRTRTCDPLIKSQLLYQLS